MKCAESERAAPHVLILALRAKVRRTKVYKCPRDIALNFGLRSEISISPQPQNRFVPPVYAALQRHKPTHKYRTAL